MGKILTCAEPSTLAKEDLMVMAVTDQVSQVVAVALVVVRAVMALLQAVMVAVLQDR